MVSTAPSKPRRQNCWTLEIIASGRLMVRSDERRWHDLRVGDGVLYPPDTVYQERIPDDLSPRRAISVAAMFDWTDPPTDWLPGRGMRLIDDPTRRLLPALETATQLWHAGDAARLLSLGGFLRVMASVLLAETRGRSIVIADARDDQPHPVRKAHQYMRQNLDRSVRVEALAAEAGMSPSGFAHAYRRITGQTPMAAMRRMRVETAASLIARGGMTLEQIAVHTGFADAFHLSRTFKKMRGVSPRQYSRGLRPRSR